MGLAQSTGKVLENTPRWPLRTPCRAHNTLDGWTPLFPWGLKKNLGGLQAVAGGYQSQQPWGQRPGAGQAFSVVVQEALSAEGLAVLQAGGVGGARG